jgi:hypothetical protein
MGCMPPEGDTCNQQREREMYNIPDQVMSLKGWTSSKETYIVSMEGKVNAQGRHILSPICRSYARFTLTRIDTTKPARPLDYVYNKAYIPYVYVEASILFL